DRRSAGRYPKERWMDAIMVLFGAHPARRLTASLISDPRRRGKYSPVPPVDAAFGNGSAGLWTAIARVEREPARGYGSRDGCPLRQGNCHGTAGGALFFRRLLSRRHHSF